MRRFLYILAYVAIVSGIIRAGWDQPLRYFFLTSDEIAKLQRPVQASVTPEPAPAATPAPSASWLWDPARRTGLDKPGHH